MFFILLILMVMFIMVITLEVTSMITCGQMVAAMTLICSTRDASPVSLATRASIAAMHSSQVGAAETEKEEKARMATNVAADNFMVEVE